MRLANKNFNVLCNWFICPIMSIVKNYIYVKLCRLCCVTKLTANVPQIGGRFNAANVLLCSRCGFLAVNFNRSKVFLIFFCAVG